jgi:Bacterial SH3 domain
MGIDPVARDGCATIPGIIAHPRNKQAGTKKSWSGRLVPALGLAVLVLLAGGCSLLGKSGAPTTTRPTTTVPPATSSTTTSTTLPVSHINGPQTVLSPIGLNVRAGPSKSAKVIATAAQGTVFQLLAHTNRSGGWYKVHGPTVTGWMSADTGFSAPGRFGTYTGTAFSVLFPAGWTSAGTPKTGVVFRPPSSIEEIVITIAPSVANLPSVNQGAGVSQNSSEQVVACGITGRLHGYTTANPDKYYADAAFSLSASEALGLKATLTSLSQMRTVLDFVNSISFPLPVCVGGATSNKTTAT